MKNTKIEEAVMERQRAVEILSVLAEGVDPFTGEIFPDDSPYQNVEVTRALCAAIESIRGSKSKAARLPKSVDIALSPEEEEQYNLIRTWRNGLAEKLGFRPYVIMNNSTIKEIIKNKIKTKHELEGVKGIGNVKLQRFGDLLIKEIAKIEKA